MDIDVSHGDKHRDPRMHGPWSLGPPLEAKWNLHPLHEQHRQLCS